MFSIFISNFGLECRNSCIWGSYLFSYGQIGYSKWSRGHNETSN